MVEAIVRALEEEQGRKKKRRRKKKRKRKKCGKIGKCFRKILKKSKN